MKKTTVFLSMLLLLALAISPITAQEPIEFMRFFGECEDEYSDIADLSDPSNFAGECSIIQIMTNAYNAENPDNAVTTTVVDWPGYTELNTRLAAGDAPDVMILHGIRIPNYASRGLLTPLDPYLEQYGIDINDFTDTARSYVSYEDQLYGIPLDVHGHLYYINLDLWEQAGMLDENGMPIIPTNVDDWRAAAQTFYDATGVPFFEFPAGGTDMSRDWMALVYQQGGTIQDDAGNPTVNTPEGLAALELILSVYDGVMSSETGATDRVEAFANNLTGSTREGTWQVNNIDAQAASPDIPLERFYVTSFPQFFDQPATWSSTHAMIVPLGLNPDPERIDRVMKFLSWMNEHNSAWAYTGHVPVNKSFLESADFEAIPHRGEYANFSTEAVPMPRLNWVTAFEDIMNEEIQSAVLGDKSAEQALADAQSRFDDFAAFGQ
ncbi:extracellular solute-binding protein [Phototrophicus methaneseepsis]|uniref:Extracellular solute-binding protein n=1 Tax=Phototrophicus methaneseepsis TaxID=2710758 RepID=A0A7S8EAH5_9CHLR|nr:extracellular solute-binding protein [Phototrophicus methaneseepsis]QPC83392.1 extracellular solute-binding protein [Phototrophicus methaneseepsis]